MASDTMPGDGRVEGACRLARLEEHVGVLGRPAQHGTLGRERPAAERPHVLVVDHGPEVVVGERRDLADLVRGAEPVEEVEERHPAPQRGTRGRSARGPAPPGPRTSTAWRSPTARTAMTSLWSPKIESACVATVRAATWMTAGESSPAILNMLGSISSRPCEAVNVVARAPRWTAPWIAPAAPASLCISTTSGTVPHRLGRPVGAPRVAELAHGRRGRDRVDRDHLAQPVGDGSGRLVAVDADPGSVQQTQPLTAIPYAKRVPFGPVDSASRRPAPRGEALLLAARARRRRRSASILFYTVPFGVRGLRMPVGDDSLFYVVVLQRVPHLGIADPQVAARPAYPLLGLGPSDAHRGQLLGDGGDRAHRVRRLHGPRGGGHRDAGGGCAERGSRRSRSWPRRRASSRGSSRGRSRTSRRSG